MSGMLKKYPIIGVMGASAASHDEQARPLGEAIAKKGWHLLTGGGPGVMEAVAQAFTAMPVRKGLSLGILPTREAQGRFALLDNYPNPYIELPIVTNLGNFDGHDAGQVSRNFINILSSDVVVVLPGSKGTRNEVALCQKFTKPFILFGPREAFSDFPVRAPHAETLEGVLAFIEEKLSSKTSQDGCVV